MQFLESIMKTKANPVTAAKTKTKAKVVPAVVKPVAKIIDTSKKAKRVDPVVVQKALKAKKVSTVASMTLSELKAKRIEIAEQIISSGVHWTKKDGQLVSVLDQTEYWEIVQRINTT
jgi:hypothetical protein